MAIQTPTTQQAQQAPTSSTDQLLAEIKALREQNAALAAKAAASKSAGTLTLKCSGKGALSVYGLGRFPVTLYREQWERLLAKADDIHTFIAANQDTLSVKDRN